MAKDDYFVVVCKILCYLYDRLKNGKSIDLNYLSYNGRQFNVEESLEHFKTYERFRLFFSRTN